MPFDPLETDERLAEAFKRGPELETRLAIGCGGFVVIAFIGAGLFMFPFVIWPNIAEASRLYQNLGIGATLAGAFGFVAARKFGLAAAGGFVSAMLASALFLYIRLSQFEMGRGIEDLPQPAWPPAFVWLIPASVALFGALIAAAAVHASELQIGEEPQRP